MKNRLSVMKHALISTAGICTVVGLLFLTRNVDININLTTDVRVDRKKKNKERIAK